MNPRLKNAAATLPGVGVAFLPKVVCPMCSPAYTALLSSVGLPFLATDRYVLPLTLTFMTIAIGSLYVGAAARRGLGPFRLGLVAAASIAGGKFWFDSLPAIYFGVALLVAAAVWNAIPNRNTCPACKAAATK
jgi:mercuric ion transport protein